MEAAAREQTEAESATLEVGFSGFIHGVALVDLLQIFHYSRRSLTLHVEPSGAIHVKEGEIIHARAGEIEGEVAIHCLLQRTGGRIRTAAPQDVSRTVDRPFNFLLLDALRDLDETARDSTDVWSHERPVIGEISAPPRGSLFPSLPVAGGELLATVCTQLFNRVEDSRAVAIIDRREKRLLAYHGPVERALLERECLAAFDRPELARLSTLLHPDVQDEGVSAVREVRLLRRSGLFLGRALATRAMALVLCTGNSESPGLAWTELRQSTLMVERILV
jgi:hypothetical protein